MDSHGIDAVVLYGGGLDAAAMVELTGSDKRLHLLYVDYGAKAAPAEKHSMLYFAEKHKHTFDVVPLPPNVFPPNPITNSAMTDDHKDDYLPGRNLLLAALAFPVACRLKAKEIWLGAAPTDDPYMLQWARDMQQPFVDGFNITTAFAYGIDTPRFRAPLLELGVPKETYVKWTFKTESKLFQLTASCYQSSNIAKPCGKCAHCIYREQLRKEVTA